MEGAYLLSFFSNHLLLCRFHPQMIFFAFSFCLPPVLRAGLPSRAPVRRTFFNFSTRFLITRFRSHSFSDPPDSRPSFRPPNSPRGVVFFLLDQQPFRKTFLSNLPSATASPPFLALTLLTDSNAQKKDRSIFPDFLFFFLIPPFSSGTLEPFFIFSPRLSVR